MKYKFFTILLVILASTILSQKILNAQQISYRRPLFDFDYNKPLFRLDESQASNSRRFLRYYALTGYREGIQPIRGLISMETSVDREQGTIRSYWINNSIVEIVTNGSTKSSQVELYVKDPSKYRYSYEQGSKLEWLRKNTYCLEFLVPISSMSYGSIMEQVNRIFNVGVKTIKKMVDVLVLVRSSKIDKIKATGENIPSNEQIGLLYNFPLSKLTDVFADAGLPYLIDQTNYQDRVDLNLKVSSWKDLNALRESFRRYDLDLLLEKREMEITIITENDYK